MKLSASVSGNNNHMRSCLRCGDSLLAAKAEALACGLPVNSPDAPFGPAEIRENGEYGKLVPVGDAQKMAEAILEMLEKPKAAPPEESWNRFTLEKVTDCYLEDFGFL